MKKFIFRSTFPAVGLILEKAVKAPSGRGLTKLGDLAMLGIKH